MEESHTLSSETRAPAFSLPEYISVKEAARIMRTSKRCVYFYIDSGRLPSTKINASIMLRLDDVTAFQRKAPGKTRTRTPPWRLPPEQNTLSVTMMTVRVHPGQRTTFTEKLADMHQEKTHPFSGTAARYIISNQSDPDEITIILVWRMVSASTQTQRDALTAWVADFAEVLDWNMARVQDGQGLLHA